MTYQMCPKIHSSTIVYPKNIQSGPTRRFDEPTHVQGSLYVPFSLSSIVQQHITQGLSLSYRRGPRIIRGPHYLRPSYRTKVYPKLELHFGRKKRWQDIMKALREKTGYLLDFSFPWEICDRILFAHQTRTGLFGYLHKGQKNSTQLAKRERYIEEICSVKRKGQSQKNCRIFLNFPHCKRVTDLITKSLTKLLPGTLAREQMGLEQSKHQEPIKLTNLDLNETKLGNRISSTINPSNAYEQLTSFACVRQNPSGAYIPLHSDCFAIWLQVLHILGLSVHSDVTLNCLHRKINLLMYSTVFIHHDTQNLVQHVAVPCESKTLTEFSCLWSNVGNLPIVSEASVNSIAIRHKTTRFQSSEVVGTLVTASHTRSDLLGSSFWVNFIPLVITLHLLWTSTVCIALILSCQGKTVQKSKSLSPTVMLMRFKPKQLKPTFLHPTTVIGQKHSLTGNVKSKFPCQSINKKDTTVPPIVSRLDGRTSSSCIKQIHTAVDQSLWSQKNGNRSVRTGHQRHQLPVCCSKEPMSIIQSNKRTTYSPSQERCCNGNNKSHTNKELPVERKLLKVRKWLVRNLSDMTSAVQPTGMSNLANPIDSAKKRRTTPITCSNPIRNENCDKTNGRRNAPSHHMEQELEPGEVVQPTKRCLEMEENSDQKRREQLIYKWLMDQPDPAHYKNISKTTQCGRVQNTSHMRTIPRVRNHHQIPISNPMGVASRKLATNGRVCHLPHLSENQNNISAYESSMPVPSRIKSGNREEIESKMSNSVGCAACCMPKHLTNSIRRKYFHSVDISIAPRLITLEQAEISRYFHTPPSHCGDSTFCVYRALMSQMKRDNYKTDAAVCTDRTSVIGGTDTMQSDLAGFSFSTQINTRSSDTTSISPDVLGPPSPSFSKSKWMMKRKWAKFKQAIHKLKRTARKIRTTKRIKRLTNKSNASTMT
ncbi:hypothetical protein D915_002843 [Fasciola hepatica]|uniref:Uncharacterized protein n=1 Tax=Fasciola hepatica TaxID=6192 RepID=A0A4E0RX24_FASHE|nr:hypothetical protein D915_002843 [Fasciola hepatica]